MAQIINTKHFGPIEFEKTWVSSDSGHIGLLVTGGYAHLTGQPVTKKRHLIDLIPDEKEQKKALEWWDNRDKIKETKKTKRIMLEVDGSYKWEDGSPITTAADILTSLPPGPQQEAVLAWFHTQHAEQKVEKETEEDRTASAVKELAKEVAQKQKKTGKKK